MTPAAFIIPRIIVPMPKIIKTKVTKSRWSIFFIVKYRVLLKNALNTRLFLYSLFIFTRDNDKGDKILQKRKTPKRC